MNKKITIFITGVAGFVGYHLAKDLISQGYKVCGVDSLNDYYDPVMKKRRLNDIKSPLFIFKKLNLKDYDKLFEIIKQTKPEIIIHLAAQAGVPYSLVNPWAYVESNYLGTLNIFESARNLNIKKIIFASSASVYGGNEKLPFTEIDRTDNPLSLYAATKKANELLATAYHFNFGIHTAGLRFFNIYGVMGRPDMAFFKFCKAILSNRKIELRGHGQMERTYTHISDVLSAINSLIINDNFRHEIYNVGGDEVVRLDNVVRMLEIFLKKKAKLRLVPAKSFEIKTAIANTNKAKKELHYSPKMSIEKGLEEYANWFKSNKEWLLKIID